MPAHRKSSLERYIPPRRSDTFNTSDHHQQQEHNESYEYNHTSPDRVQHQTSFSEIKDQPYEPINWNDQIEMELEMQSLQLGGGWKDEPKQPPQQSSHQSPPGGNEQQGGRGQGNWNRGESAPPRNYSQDQGEWYKSIGRGRGRGYPPSAEQLARTNAQKTLSARHQRKNSNEQLSPKHRSNEQLNMKYRSSEQLSPRHRGGGSSRGKGAQYADADGRWKKEDDQMSQTSSHDERKNFSDLRQKLGRQRQPQSFEPTNFNQHDSRTNQDWKEQKFSEDRPAVRGSEDSQQGRQSHSRNENRRENRSRDQRRNQEERNGTMNRQALPRPKKNTENFSPSFEAPEMRILFAPPNRQRYNREYSTRDVVIVSDLFGDESDMRIYKSLLQELTESGVPEQQLWQSWHGDSHLIADDKRRWKDSSPTFQLVMDKLKFYFNMEVKATRLNWYRDTADWKPFHHDAAALKPDKARTQNFTVAVSFGVERDAAFEHARNKTVISMPQPNGTVYTFGRDVNILWRHGVPQVAPESQTKLGRISIIAWGWIPQFEL